MGGTYYWVFPLSQSTTGIWCGLRWAFFCSFHCHLLWQSGWVLACLTKNVQYGKSSLAVPTTLLCAVRHKHISCRQHGKYNLFFVSHWHRFCHWNNLANLKKSAAHLHSKHHTWPLLISGQSFCAKKGNPEEKQVLYLIELVGRMLSRSVAWGVNSQTGIQRRRHCCRPVNLVGNLLLLHLQLNFHCVLHTKSLLQWASSDFSAEILSMLVLVLNAREPLGFFWCSQFVKFAVCQVEKDKHICIWKKKIIAGHTVFDFQVQDRATLRCDFTKTSIVVCWQKLRTDQTS